MKLVKNKIYHRVGALQATPCYKMRLFYYDVFAELYGFFDENGVGGIVGIFGVVGNAPTRLHH
ncbi:MAG: hypothetical protein LBH25_06055 [Fibromonadaceae bacterium]|jgi:hypothetical protein|nr:hypothetical protein [Fibromonadaceae bacterium]